MFPQGVKKVNFSELLPKEKKNPPFSLAKILSEAKLPERIREKLVREPVSHCSISGVVRLSKAGCVFYQIGSKSQFFHTDKENEEESVQGTRRISCPSSCPHRLDPSDFDLIQRKIKRAKTPQKIEMEN